MVLGLKNRTMIAATLTQRLRMALMSIAVEIHDSCKLIS